MPTSFSVYRRIEAETVGDFSRGYSLERVLWFPTELHKSLYRTGEFFVRFPEEFMRLCISQGFSEDFPEIIMVSKLKRFLFKFNELEHAEDLIGSLCVGLPTSFNFIKIKYENGQIVSSFKGKVSLRSLNGVNFEGIYCKNTEFLYTYGRDS